MPDRAYSLVPPAFALAILAAAATAQVQSTLRTAPPGGSARAMEPWRRTLTASPDGSLWSLVFEADGSGTPAGNRLWLLRSRDNGNTWVTVADTPTDGDGRGSLVADADCGVLHVAWYAEQGTAIYSSFYQAFDITTSNWIGTPTVLLQATNSNDQYYVTDIERTAQGTIAIAFHAHRAPTIGGLNAWAAGLMVKRRGDGAFQGPYRINTDLYGINASLQAVGEVLHASFRTNTGLYGIRYRAFDSSTLQFVTAADIPLLGGTQGTMLATNTTCTARDLSDNVYVLYSTGGTTPGQGAIQLAFTQAGNYSTFTTQVVAADPDLLAGNVTYTHFTLCRGEGDQILAIYSKRTGEQHQNLYMRVYAGGVALTPELPLAVSPEAETFAVLGGMRGDAVHSSPMLVTGGTPVSQPGGLVQFFGLSNAARTVEFGTACRGALPTLPRLRSESLPLRGTTFRTTANGLPPSAFGILFLGTTCLRPPVALDPFGMPGCAVFHDVGGSFGFTADATGRAPISFPIAPTARYINSEIHLAALVLAPGANAGGAISTNALACWFQ